MIYTQYILYIHALCTQCLYCYVIFSIGFIPTRERERKKKPCNRRLTRRPMRTVDDRDLSK